MFFSPKEKYLPIEIHFSTKVTKQKNTEEMIFLPRNCLPKVKFIHKKK